MESVTDNPPVVVILGQTASGKSALAMELAQRFNGEIIAADSRTVYTGMDIGTAKPSTQDRQKVRHHLIDVVSPKEPFTVADFQKQAHDAIKDIASRGKVSFIVGGSGLYIDSIIYDFSFRPMGAPAAHQMLVSRSVEELQAMIIDRDLPLPENRNNPRHLIRTLETNGAIAKRQPLRPNTLVLGLQREKDQLEAQIVRRVEQMVVDNFVDEVAALADQYGWDTPALQAPGYRAFRDYLEGRCTLDEAKQRFVRNDLQYAKRQKTWFRRHQDIRWISKMEEAVVLITTFLNK